jgi:hypothetical protein
MYGIHTFPFKCQKMKNAFVIINGIRFPFFLVEKAIAWAKKEKATLNALFLLSGEEMPEGYAFPSDIDLAETYRDKEDTEKDSAQILRDQMKLYQDMIKTDEIPGKAEALTGPALEKVWEKVEQADLLFVAPEYGETAQLAIARSAMEDLIEKAACPVEVVYEDKTPR